MGHRRVYLLGRKISLLSSRPIDKDHARKRDGDATGVETFVSVNSTLAKTPLAWLLSRQKREASAATTKRYPFGPYGLFLGRE